MSRKVKRIFLFKTSKPTQDKTADTYIALSDINIISEAENILDKYISSMGYKNSKKVFRKKHTIIAAIFSFLALCGVFILFTL